MVTQKAFDPEHWPVVIYGQEAYSIFELDMHSSPEKKFCPGSVCSSSFAGLWVWVYRCALTL